MQPGRYEFMSEFARSYVARGEALGQAVALLTVLGARGIQVDVKTRQDILRCTDRGQLERWIVRSATASSFDDVFTKT